MKRNKLLYLFFIILFSCSNRETKTMSEIKYSYSEEFEKIKFDIQKGYECEKNGMYNKKIHFDISHEEINIYQIPQLKLRVSWREYFYLNDLGDGSFDVTIPFCKKKQIPFILTFDILDKKNKVIYIWSLKQPVELWKRDTFNIVLKKNGDYYFGNSSQR